MNPSTEAFCRLFRGRENAYGRYIPASNGDGKKVKTIKSAIPEGLWEKHLEGKGPFLGVVPVMVNNTCYWGAIDLDDDNADHVELERQVNAARLPLVVCRSKSGGAHLFLFLVDPAPARVVMNKLRAWSQALGLKNPPDDKGRVSSIEVFPKQANTSDTNLGNWINLPYYNAKKTNRYAIIDGKHATLDQFLRYAKEKRVTAAQLESTQTNSDPSDDDFFKDGPPCLQKLHADGLSQGMRNSGLFNMAIYLKLKYPDDWDERVEAYNEEKIDPPLPDDEVRAIIRSLDGKDYVYKCNDAPICEVCNRRACNKQPFGIKAFHDAQLREELPEMTGLTKILTDPPRWSLDVAGTRVDMTTDDLITLNRFRRVVLDRTNIVVPQMKVFDWDKILRDLMQGVEEIQVPQDAGTFGQFHYLVQEFLKLRHKSDSRESILIGNPWSESGKVYFRSTDLWGFLQRRSFHHYDMAQVYNALRSLGAGHAQFKLKNQNVQVWTMPTPNDQTGDLDLPKSTAPEF